jgi:cytochrome c1
LLGGLFRTLILLVSGMPHAALQRKTGDPKSAMPPLPPDTTDQQINDLVDFLTLKG